MNNRNKKCPNSKCKLSRRWKVEKDKMKKISFVCFLTASICYFIISIMNFIDKNTSTAVTFLCLGCAFLCLSFTHLNKSEDNNNKDK